MPNSKKVLIRLEHGKRRSFLLFVGVAFLSFLAGGVSAGNSVQPIEPMSLVDRWVRPDGSYILELREFGTDGSLVAAYYNPKPIHVSKTDAVEQGGMVQVMIELQDVGYPGSTYVLRYKRAQDTLQGIYFHPASQQSYEVGFVRQIAK